ALFIIFLFSYIYELVPKTLTKTQKRGQSSFQKMKKNMCLRIMYMHAARIKVTSQKVNIEQDSFKD
ncbi:unnamed protein product, partial [marine sediment metagenome]